MGEKNQILKHARSFGNNRMEIIEGGKAEKRFKPAVSQTPKTMRLTDHWLNTACGRYY